MIAEKQGATSHKLATDIKRQFGEEATTRFLRTLPAFKVVSDLPEHLRQLLERLEETEASGNGGR